VATPGSNRPNVDGSGDLIDTALDVTGEGERCCFDIRIPVPLGRFHAITYDIRSGRQAGAGSELDPVSSLEIWRERQLEDEQIPTR
jgi:hypothetical protein